jgi:drug/metabolite transporter (DMT)-like permease
MGASLFWMFVVPPWNFAEEIRTLSRLGILVAFAILSVVIPYICFFSGLKRVPASRAGIVSTWEPVMICITAWLVLSEHLSPSQVVGIACVLAAIAIVELFPRGEST